MDRIADEIDAVIDELNGRVDFVRHTGGELADRFEPFRRGQPDLRLLALGHVQVHAGHALRLAEFVGRHGAPAAVDPAPAAVFAAHAVLDAKFGLGTAAVLQYRERGQQVIGVQQLAPHVVAAIQLVGFIAEHGPPAVVEPRVPGLQVHVPQPEIGAAGCYRQPVLERAQRLVRVDDIGDVAALRQDPHHLALVVEDRQQREIHDADRTAGVFHLVLEAHELAAAGTLNTVAQACDLGGRLLGPERRVPERLADRIVERDTGGLEGGAIALEQHPVTGEQSGELIGVVEYGAQPLQALLQPELLFALDRDVEQYAADADRRIVAVTLDAADFQQPGPAAIAPLRPIFAAVAAA